MGYEHRVKWHYTTNTGGAYLPLTLLYSHYSSNSSSADILQEPNNLYFVQKKQKWRISADVLLLNSF